MKTLSAKEMFKEEEKLRGGKSYWAGEQRVNNYGKINATTSYRIIERTKWICSKSPYNVEVLSRNEDGTYNRTDKPFWDEEDPKGGRIVGKKYKSALEFAYEYINELKNNELKSNENKEN